MRRLFFIVFIFFFSTSSALAALSCTVSAVCNSPDVTVFRMSATSNAHAELPSQSNYANLVCCSGVTGLANSCANTYSIVARLSSDTNAHIEENNQSTVAYDGADACLSVTSGTVSVGYQDNNCSGFDTIVASMSSATTNSHVGESTAYTRKICASAASTSTNNNQGGGVVMIGLNRPPILQVVDFNNDGKVNILDLSILLYFFNNLSSTPNIYDLNKDGKIGFPDVSVLFFYWGI